MTDSLRAAAPRALLTPEDRGLKTEDCLRRAAKLRATSYSLPSSVFSPQKRGTPRRKAARKTTVLCPQSSVL